MISPSRAYLVGGGIARWPHVQPLHARSDALVKAMK